MAHRGRLNVLANIVGKPYEKIFSEFEGHLDPQLHAGLGRREVPPRADGKFTAPDGEHAVKVSLAANPSHLEAVDPVVEGMSGPSRTGRPQAGGQIVLPLAGAR